MSPRKQEPVFGIYMGEVVFDDDPLGLGRVRAKVAKLSGEIPLPWADPIGNSGAGVGRGFYNPPAKGDTVAIAFDAADFNRPIYWTGGWGSPNGVSDVPTFVQGQEDTSPVKRGLETDRWRIDIDDEDSATGGSFTIRDKDEDSTIQLRQNGEIRLENGANRVSVEDAKIVIESGAIELGAGATQSAVLGDLFKTYNDTHTHSSGIGPTGVPIVLMPASNLSTTVTVIACVALPLLYLIGLIAGAIPWR